MHTLRSIDSYLRNYCIIKRLKFLNKEESTVRRMLLTVMYEYQNYELPSTVADVNIGLLSDRLIWLIKQLIEVHDAALELEQWVKWFAFQSRLAAD
jgi:hypothetical protein